MEESAEEDALARKHRLQKRAAAGAIGIRWDVLVLEGDRGVVGVELGGRGAEDRGVAVEEMRRVVVGSRVSNSQPPMPWIAQRRPPLQAPLDRSL